MPHPYKVKCLDAIYDEKSENLVLNLHVYALSAQRIILMPRSDFRFKQLDVAPVNELHKTAAMFKGREFNWVLLDDEADQNKQLTPEQEKYWYDKFANAIANDLEKVTEGLKDDSAQIQRKLGRMMNEGKIDVRKILQNEINIQRDIK